MKTKYISQSVAIKSTWMILEGLGFSREINGELEKTVTAVYESAPAADVVEVRHGRWLESNNGPLQKCSVCGATGWDEFYYCPNCGAYMRSKDNA